MSDRRILPRERRKLIQLAVVLVALFAIFGFLRSVLGLDLDPDSMRAAVASAGVLAPLLYIVVVAFRVPLLLPSQVVLVGGGLVFGMLPGTIYGAIGLTTSAVALFVGARWAGQETLARRLPPRFEPLIEIVRSRAGAVFIAVGTGYPFGPITMYHLIAGITGMAFLSFALSVAVGATIRSATFTFFGSSLMTGDFDRLLQAAFVVMLAFVVPLLFPRPRAWIRQAMTREAPASEQE